MPDLKIRKRIQLLLVFFLLAVSLAMLVITGLPGKRVIQQIPLQNFDIMISTAVPPG